MNYTIESIADFCGGAAHIALPGSKVGAIEIDHRRVHRTDTLFAALEGSRFNGHDFIPELIREGIHHFLVSETEHVQRYAKKASFIVVDDVVLALQQIAAEHRDNYSLPLLAITGSNGKTIVKEWLNTLLEDQYCICRSPKSYNSQIGVPLSIFQLGSNDTLGVFEAGISKPGEMTRLEQILKPTVGLLTNIGDAHAVHFESAQQKFREKWNLFSSCDTIIGCKDHQWYDWLDDEEKGRLFLWSKDDQTSNVFISEIEIGRYMTSITATYEQRTLRFEIPFTDRISIENACQCFAVLCLFDQLSSSVLKRFETLVSVAMRMEVKQGLEDSLLIDDTYNADLGSLKASIDQLRTHADRDKWVILSDFDQNNHGVELYKEIGRMLNEAEVTHLITIGNEIAEHAGLFKPIQVDSYPSADDLWSSINTKDFRHKAILVKGSRKFKLEKLVNRMQRKQRITTLEIDLRKLSQNLTYFQQKLNPETKIMVMVKAFAYGTGGYEVAHFFQSQNKVDYLVVAYADEAIELREKGIKLPIMVMSPSQSAYESMIQHEIEPEIFSLSGLKQFLVAARSMRHFFDQFPIHLKLDTGMHRLGFEEEDLRRVIDLLNETKLLRVKSVFTHLSASDMPNEDPFTQMQNERFLSMYEKLVEGLGYHPDRHVLNSTGTLRMPQYQYEMVRLGIGLYGFSESNDDKFLNALGSLKSYIIQTRTVKAGESVGYARQGVADHDRRIATVALGYADGLDRRLGHGNWEVQWQGTPCPTVGNICMDMTMIDVSETDAQEGDEVIIFEGNDAIRGMAKKLGTIPYEILTNIPERVRRIYLQE